MTLEGIGPGLAERLACVEVPLEEMLGERLEGDPGGVEHSFDSSCRGTPPDQRDRGVHVVGPTRQRLQSESGRFVCLGLPVHHAVEFDARVGADHHRIGLSIVNGECFFPRESLNVVDSRLARALGLVDVGRYDIGNTTDAREQVETTR